MLIKEKLLLVPAIFLFLLRPVWAEYQETSSTPSFLKFSVGIITGALIHEGAHALVGAITGTKMSWKAGTYNQPIAFTEEAKSKDKGVAVYSAGLLSQIISAEVILQSDKIDKNDSFVRGLMT